MSGIAVVFRRDGTPVAGADLELMTAAMGHRAVDGVRHEVDGPVGVGFCSMATTPRGHGERQPFRCRGGSTIAAMDGRLDDRATLLARLGGDVGESCSDAELLRRAIERWGDGFVNRLIGDFAIVVADASRRRLLCAGDHLGVKPLYYASVGPLFVAASEVAAVLAHPAVPDDVDPAAFEMWLEHWNVPGGTVYRSISRLPMASVLVVTSQGVTTPSRYWDPSCQPDTSSRPEDLVEEYSCLAREAVRDRLRSRGPVVVAMSGGLDSTAVASSALGLAEHEPSLPEVRIRSLVFPGHPLVDESALIDTMERHLRAEVRRVRPAARTPADLAEEIKGYREPPDAPNDKFDVLLRPELGERVLLTGLGGDDWFFASPDLELARAVRHGRLLSAVRAARRGVAEKRHAGLTTALWRGGMRPLVKVAGAFAGRSTILSRAIASIGGDRGARILEANWCPPGVPLDIADRLAWSRSPVLGAQLASIDRRAAHRGFELRHPLHDVRLVELSLRLPGRMRSIDGDPRWLPRRAAAGMVPDSIRLRRDKAEFSVTAREELHLADASGLLTRAMAAPHAASDSLETWRAVQLTAPDSWQPGLFRLWSTVAGEIWQEGARERRASFPPGG